MGVRLRLILKQLGKGLWCVTEQRVVGAGENFG